ncbi:MAG: two-component sensor histidine kinase, partial [Chloroflexota bacterium]
EKGVTLTAEVASDLPTLKLDAQRMDQVLGILLDNALRYTPAGGRVCVRVERRGQDGRLYLGVSDTGPGIPAEDLPHVFDRFWRGEKSRSRAGGGSGLGLAIAKQLVEAHGGRLWAESTPGQGSTFFMELPVPKV